MCTLTCRLKLSVVAVKIDPDVNKQLSIPLGMDTVRHICGHSAVQLKSGFSLVIEVTKDGKVTKDTKDTKDGKVFKLVTAIDSEVSKSRELGSPMKKSDFHRSNRTPIQCMQAIDLYVKTTKRAMLTLSFLAEK